MNSPKSAKRTSGPGTKFLSPIHRAQRQMALHLERQQGDLGLSAGDVHMLAYLRSYGPCSVGELLRVFGLAKSTMTSALDRLVARGFATREINPADRRTFLVGATARGRALAESCGPLVARLEEEISRRITGRDLAGFEHVMKAIDDVTRIDVRRGSSGALASRKYKNSKKGSRP